MNGKEVTQLCALVRTNWATFDLSRTTVAAWDKWLARWDYGDAEAAVVHLARSGREYPPTPAQVERRLVELRAALPSVDEAACLRPAFTVDGYARAPEGAHPLVQEALDAARGGNASSYLAAYRRLRDEYLQNIMAAGPTGLLVAIATSHATPELCASFDAENNRWRL